MFPLAVSFGFFTRFFRNPADAADEEPIPQTLAARFGSKENADAFKAAFENAVSKSPRAADDEDDEGKENSVAEKKGDAAAEKKDAEEKKDDGVKSTEKNEVPDKVIDTVSADLDKMTVKADS